MGYRSQVVALIYPERGSDDMVAKYEQLKVLMATTFKEVTDEYVGSCMEWMEADRVLKFTMDDVKWYDGYPDVQMFEKMMSAFDGADDGIAGYCTEFVRIGEDTEDVEERHTGDNNEYHLQVRREIDYNI